MLWIYPLLLRLWRKLLVKFELKTQIYWKEINREPVTFASAACSLRLLIKTGLIQDFSFGKAMDLYRQISCFLQNS